MPAPRSWDIVRLFHGHGMAPLYICLEFAMAPHFFYCHQCIVLFEIIFVWFHNYIKPWVVLLHFFCIISSYCLEVHWLADNFQYWFMICCGNQTKLLPELIWSVTCFNFCVFISGWGNAGVCFNAPEDHDIEWKDLTTWSKSEESMRSYINVRL